jgi:hypothetical protein
MWVELGKPKLVKLLHRNSRRGKKVLLVLLLAEAVLPVLSQAQENMASPSPCPPILAAAAAAAFIMDAMKSCRP